MIRKLIIIFLISLISISIVNAQKQNDVGDDVVVIGDDVDGNNDCDDANTELPDGQIIHIDGVCDMANPIVELKYNYREFNGYTFGTSSCDRVRILMQLRLNSEYTMHSEYGLFNIYWGEYKYNTLEEMVNYCINQPRNNMSRPISDGYYTWTP